MTKQEFLYEHDIDSVNYLIMEHAEHHGLLEKENKAVYSSVRDFF